MARQAGESQRRPHRETRPRPAQASDAAHRHRHDRIRRHHRWLGEIRCPTRLALKNYFTVHSTPETSDIEMLSRKMWDFAFGHLEFLQEQQ